MKEPTDRQIAEMLGVAEAPPATIVPAVLVETALADEYTIVPGPIGQLHVAYTQLGISAVVPTEREDEFLSVHARTVGRPAYPAAVMPKSLDSQLRRALDTGRIGKLPVDLRQLSAFQRSVLEATSQIPPGEVRPYSWVAREIGNEGALRAVGTALGRNPVPIVIPCHRVVKSDGAVGNYAFGAEMKETLLEHEGLAPESLTAGSLRFVGSATTGIFCYPTCRNARRIGTRHRVEFRSLERALSSGFRACKVCRPG